MSEEERAAALDLLRDPRLLGRVVEDLHRCGLVGEKTNATILYLAATSRILDDPLAVVLQSSSAAGKSSLMEAVLAFVPPEHRREFSAMTGQSLYYVANGELRHKVLSLAEEEGARRASYALKLLQSEKRLTIASTSKDTVTGRLVAREYTVEGPVSLVMTTTSLDVNSELENRCLVVAVDESVEQTRAIHEHQRAALTLDGLLAGQNREGIHRLHQDAQRLLVPMAVVVPVELDIAFTGGTVRSRRDHRKLLGLVRAVTLVHQHQREPHVHVDDAGHEVRYLVATDEDAAVARRLFAEVSGNGLSDVPPQTRRLLELLAVEQGPFTRRRIRALTGWSDTTVRLHVRRLVELEMLVARREGRGGRFQYDLAEGPEVAKSRGPDPKVAGPEGKVAGGRGGVAGSGDIAASQAQAGAASPAGQVQRSDRPNVPPGTEPKSHRTHISARRLPRGRRS